MDLLTNPYYCLFLITCATSNYLKLVPLIFLYRQHNEEDYLEFISLAFGDLFLLLVTSFDDDIPLNIGVFSFLIFVWSRLYKEILTLKPVRHWPFILFLAIAYSLIVVHPIENIILQMYVYSLAFLLGLSYCQDDKENLKWGYSLYVISDCLLLFSFNQRFLFDWIIVRFLYWSGLTLIYIR